MPLLNEIVKEVNKSLQSSLSVLGGVAVDGIADLVPRIKEDGKTIEWLPCMIDNDGEATYVGIDDNYCLQIYHRCFEESYSKQKISKQYGDSNSNEQSKANLSMVVMASRSRLRKNSFELNDIITPLIHIKPFEIKDSEGKRISNNVISIVKTNYKSLEIFSRDYRNAEYFLKPETIFFEIVYTIESEFNRSCIQKCT